MAIPVSSVLLYVKDVAKVAQFYVEHFGYVEEPAPKLRYRVLSAGKGCTITIHQAAKSQKSGAAVKIVFSVADVPKFIAERAAAGLEFGAIHEAEGYFFSNAKDPAGNSISVSSRAFRRSGA
jgi:predicted enzyme related to lactoylglutathione lyase